MAENKKKKTREEFLEMVKSPTFTLSYSSMKWLLPKYSPRHFMRYFTEEKDTNAKVFGAMVHHLVFKKESFDSVYFVADKPDQKKKENKEAWAETLLQNEGKIHISTKDYEKAVMMSGEVLKSKEFAPLIKSAVAIEQEFKTEYKGIGIKGIRDLMGEDFVLDLKTCQDAMRKKFFWNFVDHDMDLQAAVYLLDYPDHSYFICAVDDDGYCKMYSLSNERIEIGMQKLKQCVARFRMLQFSENWDENFEGTEIL